MRHSQPELDKRCALLSLMFVIARDTNQLCNRMFAFAHIIACAAEHGVTVINVAFEKYAAYFQTTSQDLLCRYPPRASPWPRDQATRERLNRIVTRIVHSLQAGRLRTLRGRRIQVLQSSYVSTLENPNGDYRLDQPEFLRQLPRHQLIFFDGPLFRDRENFSKYAENLRAYFAPLPCYGERVEGLMRSTRESAEVIVGVHIRQRDYRQFRQGRHYHTAPEFVPLMRAI